MNFLSREETLATFRYFELQQIRAFARSLKYGLFGSVLSYI